MASEFKYVEGMADVGQFLKTLPLKVKDKIAFGATLTAASVGLAAVQTFVPIKTGLLYHHIRVARRKVTTIDEVLYVVFVQQGSKRARKKHARMMRAAGSSARSQPDFPYYARFIELGTSRMAANPFMGKGMAASASNALTRARDYAKAKTEAWR